MILILWIFLKKSYLVLGLISKEKDSYRKNVSNQEYCINGACNMYMTDSRLL